jgi:acetyl esterase/lipase
VSRLIIILFFLLISLLGVFRAPAYPLWILSVIINGMPWLFALATLFLLLWGIRGTYPRASAITAGIAFLLFLSPIIRAYVLARGLNGRFDKAMGTTSTPPFRWTQLFSLPYGSALPHHLIYGHADSLPQTLDFYPSMARGKKPCIIVIHGGSWSSGDSRQLPELNKRLTEDGYAVAAINYRLAPRYQFPRQTEDVRSALLYLKQHADELSIDTTSFVLLGRSAGAQIALLAAYTNSDPAIKGVIDFYGPADMVWGYSLPANPLVMDSRKVMADYLGGSYEAVPQQYLSSSPIEFVNSHSVPTLLIHGRQDPLVAYEHSIRLDKKLSDSGVRHFLLTLPWATHGFDFIPTGPGGQLSTWCIERFLQTVIPLQEQQ